MSLRLPHSVFVHIPRTGGLWLAEVVKRLEIKHQQFKGDVDSHFTYKELPEYWRQFPAFSFVRHPYSWLKSRWSHCIEHNLVPDRRNYGVHWLFDECVRDTFEETVKTILKERPGIVGQTYSTMLDGIPIYRVYQTENLPLSAYQALRTLGEVTCHQRQKVLDTSPVNGTSQMDKYRKELESLPRSLIDEFLDSEGTALTIWEGAQP